LLGVEDGGTSLDAGFLVDCEEFAESVISGKTSDCFHRSLSVAIPFALHIIVFRSKRFQILRRDTMLGVLGDNADYPKLRCQLIVIQ
jgi:hypothetical protein